MGDMQFISQSLESRIDAFLCGAVAAVPVNIKVFGHRTSTRLEPPFMRALHDIAVSEDMSLDQLIGIIDLRRRDHALSAALRLFAVSYWRLASLNES